MVHDPQLEGADGIEGGERSHGGEHPYQAWPYRASIGHGFDHRLVRVS
jgi:hypothetical protein